MWVFSFEFGLSKLVLCFFEIVGRSDVAVEVSAFGSVPVLQGSLVDATMQCSVVLWDDR